MSFYFAHIKSLKIREKIVISLNHRILFPYSINMKLILENIGQEHKVFFVACNLLQTISKHAVFFFNQSEAKVKPAMTWFTHVVFPRLAPCTMFFSRAGYWLHVFPRLVPVPCFPVREASCMISRAWHPAPCFPALDSGSMFPALDPGTMFSRVLHWLRVCQTMRFVFLSPEYSRYLHSHLDTPLTEYSPDTDLDGRLRDLWVKGLPFNAKV